ncbi:MAG: TRAP transporter large permease subunit, partial [Pseudomonadota bacterium]
LIVLGDQLKVPVGDMFAGAILPGLLLVGLIAGYAVIRTWGMTQEVAIDRAPIGQTIWHLGPLILLIICVLGSIIAGLATPTEAAGVGAFGALLIALIYGRFSGKLLMEAAEETVSGTSMIFLVLIGATCFSVVFRKVGGEDAILELIGLFGTDPWTVIFVVMGMIFLLGFVLDWLEITVIL